MKPYLNERARTLANRVEASHSDNYKYVKEFLLQEFRLVPQQLLELFNTSVRQPQETFKAHITRLGMLLDYYLNSRKITSIEELKQLLITDRVKTVLSECMVNHVLRTEATLQRTYATPDELSDILDKYCANFDNHGRPRVSAIGLGPRRNQFSQGSATQPSPSPVSKEKNPHKDTWSFPTATTPAVPKVRRCFKCGSDRHVYKDCDKKGSVSPWQPQARDVTQKAVITRVNRCAVGDANEADLGTAGGTSNQAVANSVSIVTANNNSCGCVDLPLEGASLLRQPVYYDNVSDCDQGIDVSVCNTVESRNDNALEQPVIQLSDCLELATLNFVNINVGNNIVKSLIDGGSELNIIRRSEIADLSLKPIAEVVLRGIIGKGMSAPLVRMPVRLNDELLSNNDDVNVLFAVCDELNETCILSIPTVNLLNEVLNKKLLACDDVSSFDSDVKGGESPCVNAVVTRSQSAVKPVIGNTYNNDCETYESHDDDVYKDKDETFIDVDESIKIIRSDIGIANADAFADEQKSDPTLSVSWTFARQDKAGFIIENGLLFHKVKRFGQTLKLLVIPKPRREAIIRMAHADSHFSARRTKERVITSGLFWENMMRDCVLYSNECQQCQLRARKTVFDRVPIKPTVYDDQVFHTMFMDCYGPIQPNVKLKFNYALIVVDSCSRYPFSYPLRSLHAKNVCDALVKMFEITGVPAGMTIVSDNGSNFRSALTQEFMKRFGVSSRFATAYHPVSIVERQIQVLKNTIAKLSYEHNHNWVTYLGPALFAMRSTVNENLGCPPHLLVFGHLPRGPLSILSDTWSGQNDLSPSVSKSITEYLNHLKSKLETAQHYARNHLEREQQRHVRQYNLRARPKSFQPGDKCLILQPESTASHALRRWKGPAEVIEVVSPHSYLVEHNGARYKLHANLLRKFSVQVDEIIVESMNVFDTSIICDLAEQVSSCIKCNCAVIYEHDVDFGEIIVVEPPLHRQAEVLPSQKLSDEKLAHLTPAQRMRLLEVLDRHSSVFSDVPGLCSAVQHEVPICGDFKPKRLRAYKVPEAYQAEVSRQIQELLLLGFIEASTSPQASPLVVVLKAKDKDGNRPVRLAIDYRYVNKYTAPSVAPLEDISEIIQQVGKSCFISSFDAKSGFHQCLVKPEDR
jgi:Integrase core domain/Integrase zinc binding domain